MKKTLGLVLGAGGARGSCHVGVLCRLEAAGIRPDFIVGCSMGAVVGGAYATGANGEEMRKALQALRLKDIVDLNLFPLSKGGFFKGEAAEKALAPYLHASTFEETKIPFKCVATDLNAGTVVVFEKGDLMTGIRASMSIPGVFEPVRLENRLLVDGGVLCRLPIETMMSFQPDIILAVDAIGDLRETDKTKNILSILLRSFDVMDWNKSKEVRALADIFIEPDIGDGSQYDIKTVPKAIEAGEEALEEVLPRLKKLLKIR